MRSNQRRRMAARSLAVFLLQAGKARLAASMAWRVSAALSFGTVPMISPVAGLSTLSDWPEAAWTHCPLTEEASRKSRGSLRWVGGVAVFVTVFCMVDTLF